MNNVIFITFTFHPVPFTLFLLEEPCSVHQILLTSLGRCNILILFRGTETRRAQEAPRLIEKWKTPVWPVTGRKPRTVYVYLPDAAMKNKNRRFPVLYMFDGQNVFFDEDATYGKSWGMGEYLDKTRTRLIVVAVDCNHRPPNGRLNEYSPYTFDDPQFGHITGYGRRYMRWMTETLKPMIDERYPTLPGRETTWIAGSSMGGLMSLFAVSEFNHVFSRAAALSPSVWAGNCGMAKTIRKTKFAPDTVVYMDYGSRELEGQEYMRGYYLRCVEALMERGVHVTSRVVPGGEHCEASWERQIPFFLRTLMYKW